MTEFLLRNNNETLFDWLTWETLGNPGDAYKRGDEVREFGLWRADYRELCKKGTQSVAGDHDDGALGRGWIKIYTLENLDYGQHKELIRAFLPCMTVDQYGRVVDPMSPKRASVSQDPLYVLFPYNADDNDSYSEALGTDFENLDGRGSPVRLTNKIQRWATASRSSIALIGDLGPLVETQADWNFRTKQNVKDKIDGENFGQHRDTTYEQVRSKNKKARFYSVKTGVKYVGRADQSGAKKQFLEGGAYQAMNRSSMVEWVRTNYRNIPQPAARYQVEVLTVLFNRPDANDDPETPVPEWDGFQIRDIGDSTGEIWFPALAIPSSGKAFAGTVGRQDWDVFWEENFAVPLGRARAEMLTLFGMGMQGNAQNMMVAFDRASKAPRGLIIRDIGDALLNDYVYDVLRGLPGVFDDVWSREGPGGFYVSTTVAETSNDALPRMTRLGSHILFFFPPFMVGDLAITKSTHILGRWVLNHNKAFLDYMRENIGYSDDGRWDSKPAANRGDILTEIKLRALEYKDPKYPASVANVLAINSAERIGLLRQVEQEVGETLEQLAQKPSMTESDNRELKKILCAHDMLIGAEVQEYIRSDAGKEGLKGFHRKAKDRAPQPYSGLGVGRRESFR